MNIRNTEKPALISIVVPAYNDEENVIPMCLELKQVFEQMNAGRTISYEYEVIFVNDGSVDKTWDVIEKASYENQNVRGICLSRNFGKMAALEAGFKAARGDAVITIDSDREDPPSFIPVMLEKWEQGHEIVRTKRKYCKERSFFKRKTSDLFYWFMNLLCDTQMESGMSDFGLIDRQVADTLHNFGEREMFYRAMLGWVGYRSIILEYEKGEREFGETGYTFKRMVGLAWNALSAFSTFPLRLIVIMGASITFFSSMLLIVMAILRWVTMSVLFSDIDFLVVFIILTNGMILTASGVVALYLMKIHREVQGRPNYIIWKEINFSK
mgnify:CR=1 FL=1